MTFRRIAKFSCSQMLGATSRWLREGWNKVKKSSLTTLVEGSYADDLIAHKDDKEEGFLQYKPPLALSHRCQEEEKMSARSTPSVSTHLPTAWHRISMILLPDTSRVPLTLRPNRKSTNLLPSGLIWAPWWASGSWTGILHSFACICSVLYHCPSPEGLFDICTLLPSQVILYFFSTSPFRSFMLRHISFASSTLI